MAASFTLAEKLVGGKMTKDAYLEKEVAAANKRSEMLQKIEALASQL